MYRQYENPKVLEKKLDELRNEYKKAVKEDANEEILISMHETIADLEEKINFAWQDEYKECY